MAGGRRLFFKVEALQKTGSFKARGAANAVLQLSDAQAASGVVTHSSGNHAQALAWAAAKRGIPAHIVVPEDAPAVKIAAVRGYGAEVTLCDPKRRAQVCAEVEERTGATFVHPNQDAAVVAGQGTVGLEILEQVAAMEPAGAGRPVVDAVVVPLGGGGLAAGVAVAVHAIDPRIRVIAAEPAGADDAYRSKRAGRLLGHDLGPPDTVADGLRVAMGPETWPVVRDLVERIVRVSEADILQGMRHVYERMKIAVEPSAGTGVAAVLSEEFRELEGIDRVAVVLCGGNVDLARLADLFGSA